MRKCPVCGKRVKKISYMGVLTRPMMHELCRGPSPWADDWEPVNMNELPSWATKRKIQEMKITDELVEKVKKWLGEDGREYFIWCLEEHGGVNPVYMEDGIPHPVHFREGMQIRNFMRTSGLCEDWTDHDLDNNWTEVVEKALFSKE
jgi:hypothetical protein